MARVALRISLCWAALSLAALAAALAGLEIDRSSAAEAAARNLGALWPFWIASASAWGGLTGVWLALRRLGEAPGSPALAAAVVVVVAAAARVAVLAGHDPALSDDVYRYVFDGRNVAAGFNPYLVRPQDRIGAPEERWPGEARLALQCNNPELYTIYLPASQWCFGAAAALSRGTADPVAAAGPFRLAFVGADLLVIALLLVALVGAGRSPWWAALYAWHPLPVAEIAGSGHQDAIGVLLLVAALALAALPGRPWRWVPPLAAAALIKPVVLPAAAFVLRREPWTRWAVAAVVGLLICLAIGGPLLLSHGGEPLEHLRETAERFRLKWAHFGAVYEGLLWTVERVAPGWGNDPREVLARRLCTGLLVAVAAIIWWRPRRLVRLLPDDDPWAATRATLTAMALLSPVAHPWYLLWALALVPMAPGAVLWAASLTVSWGYAAWGHVGAEGAATWGVRTWIVYAAWVPVYAVLAACLAARWRRDGPPAVRADDAADAS